ncbi:hypothetical protein GBAR_LOCUS26866 [Geodia barretti]|uniref:Uncharacterized protein n=1 Tax=Geodia barretti TaxID=519541 RepID=A0AA35TKL6_GEOBA|nr:hypothetical protein GBAR_LOCUS26866 [Geodia barretti]
MGSPSCAPFGCWFFARLGLLPNLGLAIRLVLIFLSRFHATTATTSRGHPHVTLRVCLVRTAATIVLDSPRSKVCTLLQLGFLELEPQLIMFQGVPDNSPSTSSSTFCIPSATSLLTVVADNKNLTLFLQSQGLHCALPQLCCRHCHLGFSIL